MQVVVLDVAECHPAHLVGFVIRLVGADLAGDVGDHRVVSPVAVIVGVEVFHVEMAHVDADLLVGLAHRGLHGVLVGIEGSSRYGPSATTMGPRGAQLQ